MLTGGFREQLVGQWVRGPGVRKAQQQLYSNSLSGSSLPFFPALQHEPYGSEALEFVSSKAWRRSMLWTIFVILLILWLLGFSFHVAGSLIHLLLVIAVVVLLINLLTGRRTTV
jgi:Family of unknown function (DUF5670)